MVLGGEGQRIWTYSYVEGECASYTLDSMREQPTTKQGVGKIHGVQSGNICRTKESRSK